MVKINKEIIIFLSVFLILINFVSSHTISIMGEPRSPDNQIESIVGLGMADETGEVEAQKIINHDEGYFEIKDFTFTGNQAIIYVSGTCFYHIYRIIRVADNWEVRDAYFPENLLLATSENTINLGVLKEDRSNYIYVNSDDDVTFLVKDSSGNWVFENGAYKKTQGGFDSFEPRTSYEVTLGDQSGKTWTKTITTGNYCEGTRIIKRGDYLEVEAFPDNSFPPIGFLKKISLWFKGLFS